MRRLWPYLGRRQAEADIEEELRLHLEFERERRRAAGLSEADAQRAALRTLGNATLIRERTRDVWGWRWVDDLERDLRHAAHALRRSPGFAATVVLVLALGIGAMSTVFSVVNAALLQPLPYPDADRLVMVDDVLDDDPVSTNLVSAGQYESWATSSGSFDALGAHTDAFYNLSSGGEPPERIGAVMATGSLFEVLGVTLAQGQVFQDFDLAGRETNRLVVVVSQELWRRRFGRVMLTDQSLLLNDERFDVVGVLQPGFSFLGRHVDVMVPLGRQRREGPGYRRLRFLTVVGKLRSGHSLAAAQQEMTGVSANLARMFPETDAGHRARLTALREVLVGDARAGLLLVFATVGGLLLVACSNVSSLVLSRSLRRQREAAIRLASGAGLWNLFRYYWSESLVLCLAGMAVGIVVARVGVLVVQLIGPPSLPSLDEAGVDTATIAFSIVIATAAAVVMAMVPLSQFMRRDIREMLGQPTPGLNGGRSRHWLLVGQVAVAVVVVAEAGLLLTSFLNLRQVDPGFRPGGALAMDVSLVRGVSPDFNDRLLSAVDGVPGVRAAGLVWGLPLSGETSSRPFSVGSTFDPGRQDTVELRRVTAGYFAAMGMRLVAGELLRDHAAMDSEIAVLVNESFVRRVLSGANPIDRTIAVQDGSTTEPWRIVGVVNDVRHTRLDVAPVPEVYVSLYDRPWHNMTLVVRTTDGTEAVVPAIRRLLTGIHPTLPLANVRRLQEIVVEAAGSYRFNAFLVGVCSMLLLALCAMGIYSVTSHGVSERVPEIGIRMALGARRIDVVRLIVWQTMRFVAAGLVLGAALSVVVAAMSGHLLFGVGSLAVLAHVQALAILAAVALAACVAPAVRASGIDPVQILRH